MIRSRGLILFLTCLLMFLWVLSVEVMGFEGFGANTSGGDNGTPVEVTSLRNSGPGTLRAALSGVTNRRIVFNVGGTIVLNSPLELRNQSSITIDGSSAPAPGITLRGHGLAIRSSHDIIVTHLRVRNAQNDGIMVRNGSYNIVIDHCSVANSGGENISITEATSDVSVSWCLLGDTRTASTIMANTPDWAALKTKGMRITNVDQAAVTRVSLHHNLFTNAHQRSPLISTAGLFDLRNNVLREWWNYGMRLRDGAWGNIINNVFVSQTAPQRAVMLESAGPVHINGNQGPGSWNVNALSTTSIPFAVAPVTTDPVAEVAQKVLGCVGALPRNELDLSLAGPADSDCP
jgi:pectate lyase